MKWPSCRTWGLLKNLQKPFIMFSKGPRKAREGLERPGKVRECKGKGKEDQGMPREDMEGQGRKERSGKAWEGKCGAQQGIFGKRGNGPWGAKRGSVGAKREAFSERVRGTIRLDPLGSPGFPGLPLASLGVP